MKHFTFLLVFAATLASGTVGAQVPPLVQ